LHLKIISFQDFRSNSLIVVAYPQNISSGRKKITIRNELNMKKLLLIAIFGVQLGCSKKESPPVYSSSFSFKANNKDFSWNFNFAQPTANGFGSITQYIGVFGYPNGYMLSGFNQSKNISLYFFVETNALATGTYKLVTTTPIAVFRSGYIVNGTIYFPLKIGDSVMVTISTISGNKASGIFNAVMHAATTMANKVEITNGHFDNLIISN
jgi:hypothetical protein